MTSNRVGPIRFLWIVIGGWCAMRAGIMTISGWPVTAEVEAAVKKMPVARMIMAAAMPRPASLQIATGAAPSSQRPTARSVGRYGRPTAAPFAPIPSVVTHADAAEAPPAPLLALPLAPAPSRSSSRWHGSAWLFARDGGTVDLARFGQLGGSQAGARIAWRIDGSGRIPVSIAARAYAPLRTRDGAEGAVGIEVEPLRDAALRLSIERRFRVTRGGRNAWSAYAAGGMYREFGPGIVTDAYAQTGIVGARRRDLFIDGAIRTGRRFQLADGHALIFGAGAWGAAQPGVSRIDVGPRAAIVVPIDKTTVTLASEYRIRVAGDARPGSGLALTLATDF